MISQVKRKDNSGEHGCFNIFISRKQIYPISNPRPKKTIHHPAAMQHAVFFNDPACPVGIIPQWWCWSSLLASGFLPSPSPPISLIRVLFSQSSSFYNLSLSLKSLELEKQLINTQQYFRASKFYIGISFKFARVLYWFCLTLANGFNSRVRNVLFLIKFEEKSENFYKTCKFWGLPNFFISEQFKL